MAPLTPRQRLVVGIGVTTAGCVLAYLLGVLAVVASLGDFDNPDESGDGLAWFVGAVAVAAFVASGPAGFVVARNRVLLVTPAVLVAAPLAVWGVVGLLN